MKMKKSIALVVSLILVLTVTVGGTLAFLVTKTAEVKNIFNPSKVTTEVNETFDGTTKTNVSIKNTGDTTAYIRAAVVVTWQDANRNVYGTAPVEDTDYTITFAENTGWVKGDDGFYYYTSPVDAGKNTGVLITKAEYCANAPEGYSLCIEILGSGIQSLPKSVFNTEWASSGLEAKTDGGSLIAKEG